MNRNLPHFVNMGEWHEGYKYKKSEKRGMGER